MKDPRYAAIKSLIETKSIKKLSDIFTIVPYSVVRLHLHLNYNTFRKRIITTEILTLRDFRNMGLLFEVDPVELFKIALNDVNLREMLKAEESKRKKGK